MVIYIIIFYSQELWKWYEFKQESGTCLCKIYCIPKQLIPVYNLPENVPINVKLFTSQKYNILYFIYINTGSIEQ